jgi:glutaminyl-peptide cyclotransferase
MRTRYLLSVALFLSIALGGCTHSKPMPSGEWEAEGRVELLGSIPHVWKPWTEGLLVSEGILWESTGLEGKSMVRGLDKATGKVLWFVSNPQGFFGEGLARAFGKTYVLSYKEGEAFLLDRDNPVPAQRYTPFARYEGEGWGLTATDKYLVNSNGSASLYYRDPETFEVVREVPVEYEGQPVSSLNELEFDGTYIWANQWQTHFVYRIKESDPSDVVRFELPPEVCADGTPNGIAWDEEQGIFYLTGQSCAKIWKVRFD